MSERKFNLRAIGVDYVCDDCNTGIMEQVGKMFLTDPPQWQYRCNHCGKFRNFTTKYPDVRFERSDTGNAVLKETLP